MGRKMDVWMYQSDTVMLRRRDWATGDVEGGRIDR